MSGLQAGGLKLTKASVDLPTVVQRVVRTLQPRAAARGNRIETDIKPGIAPVVTDARRVEQVLGNLILSAVKYTEVGEIRVTCYQRDREVILTVADDGIGFTPEEQGRIFRPFCPVGPRGGRALPGTGLLLTVADRLVLALGGKIKIESEVTGHVGHRHAAGQGMPEVSTACRQAIRWSSGAAVSRRASGRRRTF
jgi:signal transduction histidine kinase